VGAVRAVPKVNFTNDTGGEGVLPTEASDEVRTTGSSLDTKGDARGLKLVEAVEDGTGEMVRGGGWRTDGGMSEVSHRCFGGADGSVEIERDHGIRRVRLKCCGAVRRRECIPLEDGDAGRRLAGRGGEPGNGVTEIRVDIDEGARHASKTRAFCMPTRRAEPEDRNGTGLVREEGCGFERVIREDTSGKRLSVREV
jgi:hypothetical protein